MDKFVIVLLGIFGGLLGGFAYSSVAIGLGTGFALAFMFYYLIEIGR